MIIAKLNALLQVTREGTQLGARWHKYPTPHECFFCATRPGARRRGKGRIKNKNLLSSKASRRWRPGS